MKRFRSGVGCLIVQSDEQDWRINMVQIQPLWEPSEERIRNSNMHQFIQQANTIKGAGVDNYDALHAWSVREPISFWVLMWQYANIRTSHPYESVLENSRMPGAVWFRGARLNFAENLMRYRGERTAIISVDERSGEPIQISYAELYCRVAKLAQYFDENGVRTGDRVAAFMPNRLETVIAMLAATSLGALWSSCSPDFGLDSVMDRFGQIEPKILIAADGYFYNGKSIDITKQVAHLSSGIDTIKRVIVVPYLSEQPHISGISNSVLWSEALDNDAEEIEFVQLPFDHPVYILYSSGTTGVPKCIVHGAGGTLLQHAKELMLHTDLKRDDTILYFTTCGWMMWNWLISSLITGATVVLYEGSPGHPDLSVLWRLVEGLKITVFGTSPKFIESCESANIHPGSSFDLSSLRTMLSTGSPLSDENFKWVYREVKSDLLLASISGGTDIISCFMLGCPIEPVYAGEIQKCGLGMKVEAWDDSGNPVIGEKGELVCTVPFPSMPVGFWNDPDNKNYIGAYFLHYPNVWHHGDYIEITSHGGVIVHGRSDSTLNPGGVRIGTAEIYRQIEALDEIEDSLVVGRPVNNDVEIVLFVVLSKGVVLDDELKLKIEAQIRDKTTPRHVPRRILELNDIPRTLNGKKVELAVRNILEGKEVTNRDALSNPEALDSVKALAGLLR
jgi:acetoacetyl-CoA synthetase